jgi:hypothetical protein
MPKRGKHMYQITTKLPNEHKKYMLNGRNICIPSGPKICTPTFPLQGPPKFIPNWDFWGPCYDRNFLRFLKIFGKKNWRFSQTPML